MSFLKRLDDLFPEIDRRPDPPSPATQTALPITTHGDTAYGIGALKSECELVATATEGTRNDTLNRAATRMGSLIAGGHLTEATARAHLEAAARACQLPEKEVRTVLRDNANGGLTIGQQRPRVIAEHQAPTPLPTLPDQDATDDFWTARPELDHLRNYARARRASPYAVLGAVLTRVTALTPPWVVLPPLVGAEASLNLFLALVAPSGGGKGAAEACAADAVTLNRKPDTAGVGSGEGIAHLFARRTKDGVERIRESVLMRVAEIDTLAALGDRKGATLLPELRKAWSGEDLGFAYADPTKALAIPAHTYRLSLVAGVQPGRAQWVLDDAAGGTPQRFLWLPAVDPDAPDTAPPTPDPWAWTPPQWPGAMFHGHVRMGICDTARHTIDANRLARLRGEGEALDGHALLTRLKTAAALAILTGNTDVTPTDWDLSGHLAAVSDHTRARIVEGLRAEAQKRNQDKAEAEAARVITITERQDAEGIRKTAQFIARKLRAAPAGLTRGQLAEGLTRSRREYLDAALDRLTEAGQIVAQEGRTRRYTTTP